MKKLLALCLILTMIFALPACGEKQVVDSAGTESTAEPSVQGTTELPQENIPTTEPETTETEATNPEENETTEPETTEPAENQDEKPTEPTTQKPTEKPTEPPTTPKPTEKPTEPPTTEAPKPVLPEYTPGSIAQQIVDLINQERANAGVGSVTISNTVSRLAYVRAQELRQSWSHTRPDGRAWHTVFSDYDVSAGRGIAENLAYTSMDSPENVVNLWMNSSGHRTNMLNGSYTEIGIAVFYSGGNYYICTLYRI